MYFTEKPVFIFALDAFWMNSYNFRKNYTSAFKLMKPIPQSPEKPSRKQKSVKSESIQKRKEPSDLELLLSVHHSQPHRFLGMHPFTQGKTKGVVVRAYLHDAINCEVVDAITDKRYELTRIDNTDLFEGFISEQKNVFPYRLRIERHNGEIKQFYDPYSFLPTISDQDLYLFNEGTEHKAYKKLGARPRVIDGVVGVSFAVWAPSAKRVSVVSEFNNWDGRYHPMRILGNSGVWEIFIPGMRAGTKYKYEVLCSDDTMRLKTDPYGTSFEAPPYNSSIVCDVDNDYQWNDNGWINYRDSTDWQKKPVSVYEVHLGSWKRNTEDGNRPYTYREIAHDLANYVKEQGFTHVEFLPVAEHPFEGSWGYQVTGYFAPTHRFGSPHDFKYLVDTLHQNGIGVIMDWVPGHFPRDAFALAEFDGTHLYEHADPRQGEHKEWGTFIFNYDRREVRSFLLGSALAWLDRYHIDGLRVDAVASMLYLDYGRKDGEWIPNPYGGHENIGALEFLRYTNDTIHEYFPGALMIAEESTSWPGVTKPTSELGLGFDLKWNMGWMHDTIHYINQDSLFRKHYHNSLTFGMLYQYSENFMLVYSHDEVVHGKGSMLNKVSAGSIKEKAQTLRALYAFMWTWPGKKTLFMGGEFGQSREWKYDAGLDWFLLQYKDHSGIQAVVKDLNYFYRNNPGLAERENDSHAFTWINVGDWQQSVLSFARFGNTPDEMYLVVTNFTPVMRQRYRIGVPKGGYWTELINTNAGEYGGSGEGNLGGVSSETIPCDGRNDSIEITLPGLTTVIFKLHV